MMFSPKITLQYQRSVQLENHQTKEKHSDFAIISTFTVMIVLFAEKIAKNFIKTISFN